MKRFSIHLTVALMLAVFLSAAAAILLPAAAHAADNLRHPQLQKFEDQGGQVQFLGHAYGLDGWLLTRKDLQPRTVYTTDDGGLVMGALVDPDGNVVTQNQIVALKARLDGSQAALPGADLAMAAPSEKFYAELEKTHYLAVGSKSAPYIYMIFNTACDHCQDLWKQLQPSIASGALQVRLLPFGAKTINREGAAALESADNPQEAFNAYIGGDASALSKDKIKDGTLDIVDANTAIVTKWKLQGAPPFTIYRKLTDGTIAAVIGEPSNLLLLLADLQPPK